MSTIYGKVIGVSNPKRDETTTRLRNIARLAVTFGSYASATDSGAISTATIDIAGCLRNGKTITLRSAQCVQAGSDGSTEIYTGAITTSSPNLTFNITNAAGTEIDCGATTSYRPMMIDVVFDES